MASSTLLRSAFLLFLVAYFTAFVEGAAKCNISQGKWLVDKSLPYYQGYNCPFVRSTQNCINHGRTDRSYQKLRWQPGGCTLKKFDPAAFAKLAGGRLVVVVGDSVSKNLASSLLCMANSGRTKLVPWSQKIAGNNIQGFKHPFYGTRYTAVFSNLLVKELRTDGAATHIELSQVDPRWADWISAAEVVIFQASRWWFRGSLNQYYWNGKRQQGMSDLQAYSIGMTTVKNWLVRTKWKGVPVFVTHSPSHYDLPLGSVRKGSYCETSRPISASQVDAIAMKDPSTRELLRIQLAVVSRSILRLADVTRMSYFRPDGHLQNWGSPKGKMPAGSRDDCTHWCESGVTDAWVQVIYNILIKEPYFSAKKTKKKRKA